jgi:hypothetical protein
LLRSIFCGKPDLLGRVFSALSGGDPPDAPLKHVAA